MFLFGNATIVLSVGLENGGRNEHLEETTTYKIRIPHQPEKGQNGKNQLDNEATSRSVIPA
jgi:hypothetical protein